jgi:hypothetical protein
MKQTHLSEHASPGYRGRTMVNASADVTIAFASDFNTAGEKLTRSSVLKQGKIYAPVRYLGQFAGDTAVQSVVAALNSVGKERVCVNIAGNGIYTLKDLGDQAAVDAYTMDFLTRVVRSPDLRVTIESVRSGGQTGFDESGIKAARALGFDTTVLAPNGWKFRDKSGSDISDETAFRARFQTKREQFIDKLMWDLYCLDTDNNVTYQVYGMERGAGGLSMRPVAVGKLTLAGTALLDMGQVTQYEMLLIDTARGVCGQVYQIMYFPQMLASCLVADTMSN